MTLGMAWVRSIGEIRELIVISDSRLGGGQFWDANPKIMLLPRSDCVISFAGSTNAAYPLMLQAYNAIAMYDPAANRRLDIAHLKGHLVRVQSITFLHIASAGWTGDTRRTRSDLYALWIFMASKAFSNLEAAFR
jgi:hypothetical protein